MAGPVLVSWTTSWARPPTATSWVAAAWTDAVSGTGSVQAETTSTIATRLPSLIRLP